MMLHNGLHLVTCYAQIIMCLLLVLPIFCTDYYRLAAQIRVGTSDVPQSISVYRERTVRNREVGEYKTT